MAKQLKQNEATVNVRYKAGHTTSSTWKYQDSYCPACGHHGVWCEDDGGDYYEGERHLCTKCEFIFSQPSSRSCDDPEDLQRLQSLKATELALEEELLSEEQLKQARKLLENGAKYNTATMDALAGLTDEYLDYEKKRGNRIENPPSP